MSKFLCDEIPVGTSVRANLDGFYCSACGVLFPNGAYRCVYRGHYTDGETYHNFELRNPFNCPSCGLSINHFTDVCTSGGLWATSDVDEWIETKTHTYL